MPPVGWELEPLIPSLGGVLLAGGPGSLKTTLALASARWGVERGRDALLWLEEDQPKVLEQRMTQLGISAHPSLSIAHRLGMVLNDAAVAELCPLLAAATRPILVIDNLSLVNDGDENATKDSADFVRRLKRLQRANDQLLLLLVHHAGKAAWDGKRPRARGSSAFPAWSDSHLELKKVCANDRHVVVDVSVERHKFAPEPPLQRVVIEVGSGAWTTANAESALKTARPVRDRSAEVLATLRDRGPLSKTKLRDLIGGTKEVLFGEIAKLVASGELEEVRNGPKSVVSIRSREP